MSESGVVAHRMEEGGTDKMDLVICHEFYGRIRKNTVKRSGMALEQSKETILPVYFGSCTERTAPCTWTLVQNWPQNEFEVCPSFHTCIFLEIWIR